MSYSSIDIAIEYKSFLIWRFCRHILFCFSIHLGLLYDMNDGQCSVHHLFALMGIIVVILCYQICVFWLMQMYCSVFMLDCLTPSRRWSDKIVPNKVLLANFYQTLWGCVTTFSRILSTNLHKIKKNFNYPAYVFCWLIQATFRENLKRIQLKLREK